MFLEIKLWPLTFGGKESQKNSFENLIDSSSQEDVPSTNAFYVQSSYKALDYSLD